MSQLLTVLIIIFSVLDIASILLQKSKSAGLSGAIGGGAEQLFGTKRSRGYETILFRATILFSVLLLIVSVAKLIFFS